MCFSLKEGEQVVYNALKPLWERAFDNLEDANVYKPKNGMDIHFIVDDIAVNWEWSLIHSLY